MSQYKQRFQIKMGIALSSPRKYDERVKQCAHVFFDSVLPMMLASNNLSKQPTADTATDAGRCTEDLCTRQNCRGILGTDTLSKYLELAYPRLNFTACGKKIYLRTIRDGDGMHTGYRLDGEYHEMYGNTLQVILQEINATAQQQTSPDYRLITIVDLSFDVAVDLYDEPPPFYIPGTRQALQLSNARHRNTLILITRPDNSDGLQLQTNGYILEPHGSTDVSGKTLAPSLQTLFNYYAWYVSQPNTETHTPGTLQFITRFFSDIRETHKPSRGTTAGIQTIENAFQTQHVQHAHTRSAGSESGNCVVWSILYAHFIIHFLHNCSHAFDMVPFDTLEHTIGLMETLVHVNVIRHDKQLTLEMYSMLRQYTNFLINIQNDAAMGALSDNVQILRAFKRMRLPTHLLVGSRVEKEEEEPSRKRHQPN